ncbi:MAG: hypothetical protein RIR70_661 [Pseudomonadota bacterium]|jgi:hypothetical protein
MFAVTKPALSGSWNDRVVGDKTLAQLEDLLHIQMVRCARKLEREEGEMGPAQAQSPEQNSSPEFTCKATGGSSTGEAATAAGEVPECHEKGLPGYFFPSPEGGSL